MNALLIVLIVVSSLAFVLSVLGLVLVFAWRKTTPEVADLRNKFIAVSMSQTDIMDRLNQWMQRDDARNARKHKKKKSDDDEFVDADLEVLVPAARPETVAEIKTRLRKQLVGGRTP